MQANPQVDAATASYIDGLGAEALAKAAAYTAGNHWLLLWSLVVSAIVTWLIVRSGVLDRMQAKLERRNGFLRTFLIPAVFLLISSLLSLPFAIYTDWWREKEYGRSSQPLADFLSQGAISLAISVVVGGLFLAALYWLINRAERRWWIWSGGLTAAAFAFMMLLSPILIEPLFNQYKPVPAGPVRAALEEMAAKANIPSDRIFMYDGSRQSNNFTANVSGVLGSARIAIADVALKEASLDEVRAVTGHEIGHYVLGHIWRSLIVLSVLAIVLFFLADRLFPVFARAFGSTAKIGEPRGVPVLMFMVGVGALIAMPVTNTLSRMSESEADAYSLRTEDKPDALSSALVKTAEYRYPRPNPVQEAIFYTHPSVERRVRRAMEWKFRQR
ncbi:M48 family metallopeptidase [Sphingomonas lutea]|uniref:M48 family metallopeptidase n=2 Tax=Sphingomonas lutea TaxID=1045317 RepID=A0A7G9SKV8_9SPHN|nr:M48 family metallopeptidase [Sphingomonas lutea]